MGLQWGEMGGNNFGEFLFFLNCSLYFFGFYGVLIIPKWLIKVPGHIAIFYMILRTSNILSKCGPVDLLTITKNTSTIQDKSGDILEKYYLCKYGNHDLCFF